MKYSTHTITFLTLILHGDTSCGHKKSDAVKSITEFFHVQYDIKPQGFKDVPDVGVLDGKSRSMSDVLACPAKCTDLALCDCIRAYYNSQGDESCFSVMLSGCKNDEFTSCYPVDDSKEDYFGQDWANTYLFCPQLECLDSLGLKSLFENMTATYACGCEGYKSWCKKCYEMKDSVPFCQWSLTNYEGFCADIVDCCDTETGLAGLRKCINLAAGKAYLENADKGTPETPSNKTAESKVDSTSKEEPGSLSSMGSISSCIGNVIAATTLAAGALAHFNL